jgi:hypothetical protein
MVYRGQTMTSITYIQSFYIPSYKKLDSYTWQTLKSVEKVMRVEFAVGTFLPGYIGKFNSMVVYYESI